MSYTTEGQVIRDHVAATWTETPVEYPNKSLDPKPGDPWARLTIINLPAFRLCIGTGQVVRRFPGIASFQLFIKPNTGDGLVRQYLDTATSIFREPGLPGLTFFEPEVQPEGLDDFGWVGWTVSARFQRDEVI